MFMAKYQETTCRPGRNKKLEGASHVANDGCPLDSQIMFSPNHDAFQILIRANNLAAPTACLRPARERPLKVELSPACLENRVNDSSCPSKFVPNAKFHIANPNLLHKNHQPPTMPTKEEWKSHRETIYRIYMKEAKSLKELMAEMAEKHGFSATYVRIRRSPLPGPTILTRTRRNQYGYKFKQWHMAKNLTAEKWKAIGKLEKQRQEQGVAVTDVILGGRRLPRGKVARQIAKYSFMSTSDFMYPGKNWPGRILTEERANHLE
jgi:hypothetical protein